MLADWTRIDSVDRTTLPPPSTDVIVFCPTRPAGRRINVGRCGITGNGRVLWTINGEFGFEFGQPTHWKLVGDEPHE
jgi:hypothetical protein